MSCCKLVLLGLLVSLGASIASGAAAPARELVVTAARFTDSSSWIDPDSALFGSGWLDPWLSPQAEMALLCYAPWFPPSQWHLLRHLPLVKTALIWYYPLSYGMGAWPLEAGDQLMCELYECDTGCNPNQPTALPTSADDFIGSATLLMADYRTSVYSQLSLSRNGTQSATVQLECDGCNALWASGSWVNPFQIPPANWSGSGSGAPVTLPEPSPPPASPAPASPPPATVPLLPAASPPAPAVVASPPPPAAILSPPPPPTPAAIPANSPAPTPALPPPAAMPAVPLFSPPLPRPPSPPPPTPTAIPANSPAPTPASPPPAAMPAVPLFSPPLPRPPSPRPPAPAPAPAPEISAFAGAPDGDAIGASSSPPPFASGPAAANLPPLRSDAPRPPSPSPTSPPAAPAGQVQPASVPEQQESAKGTPTALIAGLAAAGALVASLLLVALCAWRRWRRQRQAAQASEDVKSDSMQLEKGVNIPRIRAEKPQQAAAAMRSLQAPAAIVSTPWRPEQRG